MTEVAQHQDAIALKLILSERLELFCDIVGQPRIRLPPESTHPAEEPWNLRSERVRAWMAAFVWEKAKLILLDREIDRILNVLEGKAWLDQRRDLELCEAIEQEPVLEAVLLMLEKRSPFEGSMTKLLHQLTEVARRAGLDVRSKSWPKGPPQISQRIRSLEPLLSKANVGVKRDRTSIQRTIVLKRQTSAFEQASDDSSSSPSQGASIDKSHHPKDHRRHDAVDPEKRASVFARITRPPDRKDQ